MISDLAARSTALDPQRSFIVQAPAGSGKTGLLVYRLLTLLATVDQPQQVLAITFTRKATAEMRERLLFLMHAAEAGRVSDDAFEQQGIDLAKKVLERDAQKGWNLLNTPHQLQLLTIDSFCAKLTASMPWLSRLGDRPRTTDQADTHYSAAVESLLNELLNDDSIISESLKTVLLELDFNYNKARQLFSSMLSKRDQWLRHLLQNDLPSLRMTLEQAWNDVINEQIDQLEGVLPDGTIAQLVKLAVYASQNIKVSEGQESFLAPFNSLAVNDVDHPLELKDESVNHLPVDKLSVPQWQALCKLALLADGKGFRKTVTIKQGFVAKSPEKEAFVALLSEFASDGVLRELMQETMLLPQAHFSDHDWQQLLALESVLKALAAFLQLRFRASGECDHNEVTQRANLALQELDNPTDLGLRMDYHIHHILVDEFQDTSNGQIELLKKLTSGWTEQETGSGVKTLFLVGDPMQSIYRFREADVSLFLQVVNNRRTQIFENLKIESLSLTENFRSSSDLVFWFNQTFGKSFPQKNNVLTGAINYASASSNKSSINGDVVYQLAHSKQQEAQLLVEQVKQAINEQNSDKDKVAILVRTRGQLKTILPALQEAGIDYAGVDIQPLAKQQAVIDVLSLCKAICREDDRISWMALLRGPWCGLSLSQLKSLTVKHDLTIWQQLNDSTVVNALDDAMQRLQRFTSVLEETLAQRQQVELGSLTRWAWRSLGGEKTLLGASINDIETVFNLIDDLQRGGDLPSINDLEKALQGLYAMSSVSADVGSQPNVLVSTMHKSKGLQYDTVILPGLSNRPRVDEREIMMWAEHQNKQGMSNLLLAPLRLGVSSSAHFDYLRKLESKRASNEAIRLMYVAATRAERKLVLLAVSEVDQENGDIKAPASNCLLATLWDALGDKFSFPLESVQDNEAIEALSQQLYRLKGSYQTKFLEPVKWQVTQQLNAQHNESIEIDGDEQEQLNLAQQFDWATNAASGVGTVLHRWLQYNGAKVLTTEIDQSQISAWRTELIALRVPNTHIEYALRNLKNAIENIKVDKQAHFIFETYAIESNEYALSTFEEGVVKKSIIDRTFVDANNVRWIVDYKSTPTKNEDLRAFAQEQVKTRHQSQLENYGDLMSEIDSRPIQLAVYFPLIKQLVSWPYKPSSSQ